LRIWQRGVGRKSTYLISEDADLYSVDPREVAYVIQRLDEREGLDAVRGQQDRCPWILIELPILFVTRRSWNFLEAAASARRMWPDRRLAYNFNWNRIVTSGWNTGFTAEAYAAILGYTQSRQLEEDMDIGEKISVLRGYWSGSRFVPQVATVGRMPTRSEGSPRRWLYQFISGCDPYSDANSYENFFGAEHEARVKNSSLHEMCAVIGERLQLRPDNVPLLEQILTQHLATAREIVSSERDGTELFTRVLGALGFEPGDAVVDRGAMVHVRRLDNIARRLSAYREGCRRRFEGSDDRMRLGTAV
jgi:hypothetical protein